MRVARLHLMNQCMYYEYTEKEAAVTMKITHATMAEHTIYHSSKFQDLYSMKKSRERNALNLPCFWNKKTQIVIFHFE